MLKMELRLKLPEEQSLIWLERLKFLGWSELIESHRVSSQRAV